MAVALSWDSPGDRRTLVPTEWPWARYLPLSWNVTRTDSFRIAGLPKDNQFHFILIVQI